MAPEQVHQGLLCSHLLKADDSVRRVTLLRIAELVIASSPWLSTPALLAVAVISMGVIHKCEAFKFFVSSMTHVRKLEAHTNRKFHADKSFGGVGYFNTLS